MARVEGGAVVIDTDWPGLKSQIDNRSVNFKYEEDATAYEIFAIDGQYFYSTVIYKAGQAPQDQATYDTYRADFETNYKNRVTDFNSTQPFFLSSVDGYSVVLKDGATPTANDGYGVAVIGYDGSNYRMLKSDSSGRPVFVGAGTAGTPAGGVISIQGVSGGVSLPVQQVSSTANSTSVAASATSVNLLASNANRRGATIWNDSTTATLYVKLGTTASTSSYAVQLFPTGYYEIPYGYTGNIDGIWSAAIGNARITELT